MKFKRFVLAGLVLLLFLLVGIIIGYKSKGKPSILTNNIHSSPGKQNSEENSSDQVYESFIVKGRKLIIKNRQQVLIQEKNLEPKLVLEAPAFTNDVKWSPDNSKITVT